ncbi:MAG: protein-glutamate O-methyltransferase CheR [Anaerolineae bacterium]|nr:protein-glutamate O-methyltransferase CheR [Anaerolineae bacterium]
MLKNDPAFTLSKSEFEAGPEANQDRLSPEEALHFESIRQWIYTHTGLHFPERKHQLLYPRLKKLCWHLGIADLKDLDHHLQLRDRPGLAVEVARAVTTNHTYFLREPEVLQVLQEQITPTLPATEKWRIWSAAAASGEEAYSVAMLFAEKFGLDGLTEKVALLGTDISQPMIEGAECGIYDERRLDLVPGYLKQRYFQPMGLAQWRISPQLKKACIFRRLNLMSSPWPFKDSFHVVLCRNVLYYFDRDHQRTLLERIYEVTTPGGWLLTSVTESLWGLNTRWRAVMSGVYRKVN